MAVSLSDRFGKASQAYCLSRRNSTILLAVLFSFICVLFLASFGMGVGFPDVPGLSYLGVSSTDWIPESCGQRGVNDTADVKLWEDAQRKYKTLMDDKFT